MSIQYKVRTYLSSLFYLLTILTVLLEVFSGAIGWSSGLTWLSLKWRWSQSTISFHFFDRHGHLCTSSSQNDKTVSPSESQGQCSKSYPLPHSDTTLLLAPCCEGSIKLSSQDVRPWAQRTHHQLTGHRKYFHPVPNDSWYMSGSVSSKDSEFFNKCYLHQTAGHLELSSENETSNTPKEIVQNYRISAQL